MRAKSVTAVHIALTLLTWQQGKGGLVELPQLLTAGMARRRYQWLMSPPTCRYNHYQWESGQSIAR